MAPSATALLWVLALSTTAWACSGASSNEGGSSPAHAGTAGSGLGGQGNAGAAGGSGAGVSGSGVSGSGVSGSGVSAGTSGASAGAAGTSAGAAGTSGAAGSNSGCHTVAECPPSTYTAIETLESCIAPGGVAPADQPGGCLMISWCGQCVCPPSPAQPAGTGESCTKSADCPSGGAQVAAPGAASVCSANVCKQCASNTDCPAAIPACVTLNGQYGAFAQCLECGLDADCPLASPHCVSHACVKCATDADCAVGVCTSGACAPACSAQNPCTAPFTACSAAQRCDAIPCSDSSTCPANGTCTSGYCARKTCSTDAECSGYCVNLQCYDSLGYCHAQHFYP
ncbi:MAG TPA: hypothetical protein VGI10_15960 [Polyangiaceae bacterium]